MEGHKSIRKEEKQEEEEENQYLSTYVTINFDEVNYVYIWQNVFPMLMLCIHT